MDYTITEMTKIPLKIEPSPIRESVFEIRFKAKVPEEAVFGVVFAAVKDLFPNDLMEKLPNFPVPEPLRKIDPNLAYQNLYRFKKENLSFSLGPRTFTFSNTDKYVGWTKWSAFFKQLLECIKTTDLISEVERLGLRYINVFDKNILENTNIFIKLNNHSLVEETSNLRTELHDEDGFVKIIQVGNAVNVFNGKKSEVKSIIDIDCIYNWQDKDFFENYFEKIIMAHNKQKELFFGLLNQDFIDTLNPKY